MIRNNTVDTRSAIPGENRMKKRFFFLLFLMLMVMPLAVGLAQTDQSQEYEAGLRSYNRGNFERAFEYWLPLAEEGHVRSMVFVGFMYQRGLGVARDYSKATKWLVRAENLGSEEARQMLIDPLKGIKQNSEIYGEVLKWYQAAAGGGSIDASYVLGKLYIEGNEQLDANISLGLELLRNAAFQGHVEAQYNLALIYDQGTEGILEDFKRALFWYEEASERGHRLAQYRLANMHYYQRKPPKEYDQAVSWINEQDFERAFSLFRRSAQQGYPPAQFQLARMYYDGEGVKADPIQSYIWVSLALTGLSDQPQEQREALLLREDLLIVLRDDQVKIAEEFAKLWSPRPEEIISGRTVFQAREPLSSNPELNFADGEPQQLTAEDNNVADTPN